MQGRLITRLGDGSAVAMTRREIRADLEEGTQVAAARAQAPAAHRRRARPPGWTSSPAAARFSAVDIGDEVVLSFDGSGTPQQGSRIDALRAVRAVSRRSDSCELYHIDYSYKAVKTVVAAEQQAMKEAQERVTIPVHYGAQPDLGRYSTPDGPCGNWAELLPRLRIDEARAAQEAGRASSRSPTWSTSPSALWEAGADGINFDTAGAAGDADFLATLLAVERLRATYPDMGIMVGMAGGAVVLGMHGELELPRRTAGRPQAGGPAASSSRRPAPRSSGPPSTSTPAAPWPGTWRARSRT